MRVLFAPTDADPRRTVYVDGTADGFRSLSHWPGNSTPRALKRDTSTGIALTWAACPPEQQLALLGHFDQVANNHYDTDGVLSVYGVARPQSALEHADLFLRAAATGDFGTWNGADALALDLALGLCGSHPGVGPALAADAGPGERHAAAYAWAMTGLPDLVAALGSPAAPWAERQRTIEAALRAVERRQDVQVERIPQLDLALVECARPLPRVALSAAAGPCSRILLVAPAPAGTRYRLIQRVESWFEIVSRLVPPRRELSAVARALDAAEASASAGGGRSPAGASWWAGSPEDPVCQLGHGDPAAAGDGFSQDTDLRNDAPSRLDRAQVIELLAPALPLV